jgi:membrane peptidoglycan carboxypeptidase
MYVLRRRPSSIPRRGGLRRMRRVAIRTVKSSLVSVLLVISAIAGLVYGSSKVSYPQPVATPEVTVYEYADGTPMATQGPDHRLVVPLSRVPQHVRRAVLAAEDRGFYSEPGISVTGLGRAVLNNVRGGPVQGGSTITQQYVKNAYLNSERSANRKFRELVLAIKLTRDYSKDQVLEAYLNTIYFGRGAYGIEAAALSYFGIGVEHLSVSQGAVLAAIIRSPLGYDPDKRLRALRGRWQFVVDGMVSQKWLGKAERARLRFPRVLPRSGSLFGANAGANGLVLRVVRAELAVAGFTDARLRRGGLRVRTTLSRTAQTAAVNSITAVLTGRPKDVHGAVVSLQPSTGAVLAYYGGNDAGGEDYAQVWRPPGQTLAPFLLAAAGEQGIPVDTYFGDRTLVDAMTRWSGAAFAKLAAVLDPAQLTAMALRFGVPPAERYEARPLDLAAGYGALAAGGIARAPYLVAEVLDPAGHVLYRHRSTPPRRVLPPAVANDVAYAMHGVAARVGHPLAGRMSSAAYGGDYLTADSWLAGFTPQVATVAWVGTANRKGRTPKALPCLVWQRVTEAALRGQPALRFATTQRAHGVSRALPSPHHQGTVTQRESGARDAAGR